MTETEREMLWSMTEQLSALLRGEAANAVATTDDDPVEIRALAEAVNRLVHSFAEARPFLLALAAGDLNQEPPARNQLIAPFKHLHSSLRHLTWQTQQIAAGDLSQRVDFLGEFSDAFNQLIGTLRDKQLTEEKLRYVSSHDTLTGVYNRSFFSEELARLDRGRNFPVSIIVVDLDRLKEINDTRGHAAGDRIIQQSARVLTAAVRSEDVVARIGGDEFAIILPGADLEAAARVLERIRDEEAAYNREQTEFFLGMSLGVATASTRGTLDLIHKQADRLMYEDKAARREKPNGSGSNPCQD